MSFALTYNKEIEPYIPNDVEIKKIAFEQVETYEFGKYNYTAIENEILLNPYSFHGAEKAKLIYDKLDGFNPDLTIAFSPCIFIKNIFPNTPIISYEYAAFSRKIHPENWFFDTNGPFQNSFLDKHLKQYLPNDEAIEAALNIATNTKGMLLELLQFNNYCGLDLSSTKKRFLLPLQFSNYLLFDAYTPILQQFKLAEYVCALKPKDVTLIITEHPMSGEITQPARDYLQKQYENVFFVKNDYQISTSDLLSPIIDGYIGVTSKALFLSALWQKPLISIAKEGVFHSLSSTNDINEDWSGLKPIDTFNRNKILSYCFIEGAFHKSDLQNITWTKQTINNCLKNISNSQPLLCSRDEQEIKKIEKNWISHTNSELSYILNYNEIFKYIEIVNQDKKEECLHILEIEIEKNAFVENIYLKIEHSYHIAMSLLNHKGDFEKSSYFFDKSSQECKQFYGKENFSRVKSLYWHSLFHSIYCHYLLGNHNLALQKYENAIAIAINDELFGTYDQELFSRISSYCPELKLNVALGNI